MQWITGFESTYICGSGVDVLDNTRHSHYWKEDLESVWRAGVRVLRYPVPWHKIESRQGEYNWRWMDQVMAGMRSLGLEPILDPLHHISFPEWLQGGFLDPRFVDSYRAFVRSTAQRYPWVRRYTPVNEPMLTALFCGRLGIWHPKSRNNTAFVRMLMNLGKVITLVGEDLQERIDNLEIVYTSTCEHHVSLHSGSDSLSQFLNTRRFVMLDLLRGKLEPAMATIFRRAGINDREMGWFEEHRARIDILGLDYYPHSEKEWMRGQVRHVSERPRGFAAVARDYVERYRLPIMLAETNIRGFISDRLMWLKIMAQQCEKLSSQGIDMRGACWFPWIDSTDWDTLVTRVSNHLDPVGIYVLSDDSDRHRHASELVDAFAGLAQGRISWRNLPSSPLQEPWIGRLEQHVNFVCAA